MLQLALALLALGQGLPSSGYGASSGSVGTNPAYATQGPLNLYVDPALGGDGNACTAAGALACKTVEGARQKVPFHVGDPVTISVAAGTYDGGAYLNGFIFSQGPRAAANDAGPWIKVLCAYGDAGVAGAQSGGAVSSAVKGNQGYLVGGAPAAGTAVLSPTGGGTYTDATLNGYLIRIIGGKATGTSAIIASNTGNTATLRGPWISLPDATSTYQISSWASTFTKSLPDPPGTTNLGYTTTKGAAFYVANDVGFGFGNTSSSSDLGLNVGNEPQISIEGCGFSLNTNNEAAVIASGPVNVGLLYPNIVAAYGMVSSGPTKALIGAASLLGGSCFGLYRSQTIPQVFGQTYGNSVIYGSVVNTACGAYLAEVGGGALYLDQNIVTIPTGCGGACPEVILGSGATVISSGNTYANTTVDSDCVSTIEDQVTGPLTHLATFDSDGDTFTKCLSEVNVRQDVRISAVGAASAGSGSTTGFTVAKGARVEFVTPWAATDTTDLTIDGSNYTFAQLRSGSGTAKSIAVPNTGTLVHEE